LNSWLATSLERRITRQITNISTNNIPIMMQKKNHQNHLVNQIISHTTILEAKYQSNNTGHVAQYLLDYQ